ncbi:MAG: ABC transporter permease [Clostridia bacterium]|nr:ABC transporter permease [Clostridia bacterium]
MKTTLNVLREIILHLPRTIRLALYENRSRRSQLLLGRVWDFLNPLFQILIYWFVFSVGLKTETRNGFPYAIWLMCGMMPWLAMNASSVNAANAIQMNAHVLKNVAIPVTIMPMKAIVKAYYEHLWTMGILVATLLFTGVWPTLHWLELAYYLLASGAFLTGFALITSSLSAVWRDFFEFLNPVMRLMFYISSVVWPLESLPENLQVIMFLNPFAYVVEGYRKCLLYGEGFWLNWQQGAYFWALTLLLLVMGSLLNMRLRRRFIDQL